MGNSEHGDRVVTPAQQLADAVHRCAVLDALLAQLRDCMRGAEITDANAADVLRELIFVSTKTVKQRDAALALLREVL